jgi:hypothetical protein
VNDECSDGSWQQLLGTAYSCTVPEGGTEGPRSIDLSAPSSFDSGDGKWGRAPVAVLFASYTFGSLYKGSFPSCFKPSGAVAAVHLWLQSITSTALAAHQLPMLQV